MSRMIAGAAFGAVSALAFNDAGLALAATLAACAAWEVFCRWQA